MAIKSFEDLFVWQKANQLMKEVYMLVDRLPRKETFELSSQLRRAAVSIPSNIAEGHERGTTKEYISFLFVARGSNGEVKSQLQSCVALGYLSQVDIADALKLTDDVGRLLNLLINSLKKKI